MRYFCRLFFICCVGFRLRIFGILIFWWIASAQVSFAQKPLLRHFDRSAGLPTRVVYDLHVNRKGLLFLATDRGLFSFNGIEFRHYPFSQTSNPSVNDIQEDGNGNIWCMNFSDQLFILTADSLRPLSSLNNRIAEKGPLRSFAISDEGIWLATDKSLHLFTKSGFTTILENKSEPYFFTQVKADDAGNVFVSEVDHIFHFQNGNLRGTYEVMPGQRETAVFGSDLYFVKKRSPEDFSSLKRMPKTPKFEWHPGASYANRLSVSGGKLWMCTNTGLMAFDQNLHVFKKPILQDIRVTDIVSDPEGGQWISSVEDGLFYMPDEEVLIHEIAGYRFNALCAGPGNTFFAGTGKGRIIHLDQNAGIICEWQSPIITEIEFLYFDSSENRLISSHGYVDFQHGPKFTPVSLGKSLAPDDKGNFLLSTFNSAYLINRRLTEDPNVSVVSEDFFNLQSQISAYLLRNKRARCGLYHFDEKRYYVGFSDGLYFFDETLTPHKIVYEDKEVIAADMVVNAEGYLIIATLNDGLLVAKNGMVIKRFASENGLSDLTARKIKIIPDGYILITDFGPEILLPLRGVVVRPPAVNTFSGKGVSDALFRSGKIWLASEGGLISFHLSEENQVFMPRILNVEGKAEGKKVDFFVSGGARDAVKLKHNQNDVSIRVNTLHYQSMGDFLLKYRLKGYDDDWKIQSAKTPDFHFMALPPGSFHFEVSCLFNDKETEVHSISFVIRPPFWKTIWFWSLAAAVLLLIYWLTQRALIINMRRKQAVKEKLLRSQITALRSQMNPHFMFNVLNSVQGLIFSDRKNEASQYLGKFSALMRNILEFSDKSFIPVKQEIEMLRTYIELEAGRFDEGEFAFELQDEVSAEIPHAKVPSMILQPFVENAIKHGLMHKKGPKRLKVSLRNTRLGKMEAEITDNGIGREASAEINRRRKRHNSFATRAIESRIQLINQTIPVPVSFHISDLKNESGEAAGTTVVIEIPIDDEP